MAQLSALGDLANNIVNLSEVANDINQYICVSEDATVLTRGVNDAINAVEAISVAVSKVSAAISSGQVPSSINDSLEEWSDAESVFFGVLSSVIDGSGLPGSIASLKNYASSIEHLSVALSGLTGVINGLPGDSANAFGAAAEFYGLTSTLNGLTKARSSLAATIIAVAPYSEHASVLNSVASALNAVTSAFSGLSTALVNANKK